MTAPTASESTTWLSRRDWVLPAVAAVAGIALAAPYTPLDVDMSRIEVRHGTHWVLLVHIFTAAIALLLGPCSSSRRCGHGVRCTGRSGASTCWPASCLRR